MVSSRKGMAARWRGRWLGVMTAAACLAVSHPLQAASLQVAPTSLQLTAQQNAEGLWLSNSGTKPLQVQVRAYAWVQREGREDLLPTDQLLVSPPMQTLAAGERQLVRVVRAQPAPPRDETTFRLIVDELPDSNPQQQGMQFVLRYSVPVFVLPDATTPLAPRLQARLLTGSDGQAMLEVTNHGNAHAQIADLAFAGNGAPREVQAGLVGYVHHGQTMRWPLKQPPDQFAGGTFTARINGEAGKQTLPTAPPSL